MFRCVIDEFKRQNDFEPSFLKTEKMKDKSVSETIFFNGKSYIKIHRLSIDSIYGTKNSDA